MPTLDITKDGNYIIKACYDGQYTTYQLRGNGVTFLSLYNIEVGDKLSHKQLQELRERMLVFTNGSGPSTSPSTPSTTAIPQTLPEISTQASNNFSIEKDKDREKTGNARPSSCIKLIGANEDLSRRGTFFKQSDCQAHLYIRMSQGEFMVPGISYCIAFYHQEIRSIYIPPTIRTKCIGSYRLWQAWVFDLPQQINRTIRRWGIHIRHPMKTM